MGANTVEVSRQAFTLGQSSVTGEPEYFIRLDRTNTDLNGDASLSQKIEAVRSLAGQTCTVSYWAKAGAPVTQENFKVRAIQNFGTSTPPPPNPSASNTTNFDDPALSTAWQRFTSTITLDSISGKTLGADGNDNLALRFSLLNAAGNVSIDIANVKLEAGDIAGDYRPRPIQEELALCQRYYAKTYRQATTPGATTRVGALSTAATLDAGRSRRRAGRADVSYFDWRFPQTHARRPERHDL